MKVLKAETLPPSRPFTRCHSPQAASYAAFRSCLRWEFGFTCAYCLLHETDWIPQGTEKSGLYAIDHFETKKDAPTKVTEYSNCIYACRYCNSVDRGSTPDKSADGKRLLDPSVSAWSQHFKLVADRLTSIDGDTDAQYTEETYSLNSPIKVSKRRERREVIISCLENLSQKNLAGELREIAAQIPDEEKKTQCLKAANLIDKASENAYRALQKYRAIPIDADTVCKCEQTNRLALPEEIERQTQEI